jgi:hypothetical protein
MKICTACGKEIRDDAAKCKFCGETFREEKPVDMEKEVTTKKGSSKRIGIILGVLFIAIIIVWYLWLSGTFGARNKYRVPKRTQTAKLTQEFKYAEIGEIWIIQDEHIAVLKQPKTTSDRNEFTRNLVTILGYGEKVTVLKTKLIYWKYCKVKDRYNGWILGDTVKKARKIN